MASAPHLSCQSTVVAPGSIIPECRFQAASAVHPICPFDHLAGPEADSGSTDSRQVTAAAASSFAVIDSVDRSESNIAIEPMVALWRHPCQPSSATDFA